jgi:predicted DCC family thiol-disulfide oxidoreductase YuxK
MQLTILYDASCALCARCRAFMEREPAYVALEFVPSHSRDALTRFGADGRSEQLVVVSDDGRVWVGAAAFIVCFWSLVRFRELSYVLAGPLSPLAERFFRVLSAERGKIAALFDHRPCADEGCPVHPSTPYR